jgi:ABC-type phosphate transport system substrate-binding protein
MSDIAHVQSPTLRSNTPTRVRITSLKAVLAGFGALLMVAGLTVFVAPGAGSQPPRTLTVTPSTELGNNVVEVSWTGFRPTTVSGQNSVLVYQCKANPVSLDDCFAAAPFPEIAEGSRQVARTAEDGSGRTVFEVRPAANLPVLACSQTNPCSILAFENDGVPIPEGELHPTSVVAPIAFARSQADCPKVSNFDVRLDGASSAAPALYKWAAQLCTGTSPIIVDVTETSSTTGRENFLAGLVDLGVTSQAASDEEIAAHPERGEFDYAPVDITAVTVAFNMRDPLTGAPITDVVLSPRLVARLVTDTSVADFLSDPELRFLNPTTRFPSVTTAAPGLRAERNAATRLVTSWFAADEPTQRFLAGNDPFGVAVNPAYQGLAYPRDLFENVAQSSQFLPRAGQRGVALRLFYGVRPAGSTQENPAEIGFIGIVDLPTAQRFGLATARIVNPAGQAVAPTPEAILAGAASLTDGPGGVLTFDPGARDAAAYPLVKVDYAMVPRTVAPADKAADVSALLKYMVGEGQSNLPEGYVPLPDDLRAATAAVADALVAAPSAAGPVAAPPSGSSFVSSAPVPSRSAVRSSGGSATPAGPAGEGDQPPVAVTPASAGPVLPALATTSDSVMLPILLGISGLALVVWGAGEIRPALRSARRGAGSTLGWVRSQLGWGSPS